MATQPLVSVIIPTKNAGPGFADTIEAVLSQEIQGELELLVIDSGSTDGTVELSRNYPVHLIEILPEDFGHGRTRNLGVAESRGSYIALLVQDALPANNQWLRNLLESVQEDSAVAGAFSRQVPRPGADPVAELVTNYWHLRSGGRRVLQIRDWDRFDLLSIEEKLDQSAFNNVSSLVRRSVWDKIPFPDVMFAEDVGWALQVMKAGHRLIYEPSSTVIHSHQRSWQHDLKRAYIESHTLAELFNLSLKPTPLDQLKAMIQLVRAVCVTKNDLVPDLVCQAKGAYLQQVTGHTIIYLLSKDSPWHVSSDKTRLDTLVQFLNWQDFRARTDKIPFPGQTTLKRLNATFREYLLRLFLASKGRVLLPPSLVKRIASSFWELLGCKSFSEVLSIEGIQISRPDFTAALEYWDLVTHLRSEIPYNPESTNRLETFAATAVMGKWLGRGIYANQESNVSHPLIQKIHSFFIFGEGEWDLESLLS